MKPHRPNYVFRLFACLGVLAAFTLAGCPQAEAPRGAASGDTVEILRDGRIAVDPGSTLANKLSLAEIELTTTRVPARNVTGTVVARLLPGEGDKADRWVFVDSDVDEAYEEWRHNQIEVEFQEAHLERVRRLHAMKLEFLEGAVTRMEELVATGNEPTSELLELRADMKEAEIEAESEIFEAETELVQARREGAVLARVLLQEGVHLGMLDNAGEHAVIVSADIPESAVPLIRAGGQCLVRFHATGGQAHEGVVGGVGHAVDVERRALRAFIEITDEEQKLRPGMFADVGINADMREVLTAPIDAVLHLGRSAYVLVVDEHGTYRVTEVSVGADLGRRIELTESPAKGSRIVGSNAILLRPFVERILRDIGP
jgi:membrane fusion protein, heavy metal efflux system